MQLLAPHLARIRQAMILLSGRPGQIRSPDLSLSGNERVGQESSSFDFLRSYLVAELDSPLVFLGVLADTAHMVKALTSCSFRLRLTESREYCDPEATWFAWTRKYFFFWGSVCISPRYTNGIYIHVPK